MKRLPKKNGLTAQQITFCHQYVIDFNATRAAERAKYSSRTAQEQGSRLLSKVMVQKEIRRILDKACADSEVTVAEVVRGLKKQAFYDPRKFFDEKGNAIDIHQLDDVTADAVEGFEFVTLYQGSGEEKHAFGQLRKMKLARKAQSRELLGRYLGMFKDSLEIKTEDKFDGRTIEELKHYAEHGEFPPKPGDAGVDRPMQGR